MNTSKNIVGKHIKHQLDNKGFSFSSVAAELGRTPQAVRHVAFGLRTSRYISQGLANKIKEPVNGVEPCYEEEAAA